MSMQNSLSNWNLTNNISQSIKSNKNIKIRECRMTLVGFGGVGKSSLCSQFVDNKFENKYPKHESLLFKKMIDLPEMPTFRFNLDILDIQGLY